MPVPWVWNIQFIWQLLLVFKFSLFSKGIKTLQQCKVKCGICQEGWRGGWGVRGVKGIICAATVWPQWSVCGQLATPKPWREGWCSLRVVKPLASHHRILRIFWQRQTAGLHLFQCDGELQQSFGQWDSLKVYKTGCAAAPTRWRCQPCTSQIVAQQRLRNIKV